MPKSVTADFSAIRTRLSEILADEKRAPPAASAVPFFGTLQETVIEFVFEPRAGGSSFNISVPCGVILYE
jgi:hypothetical protein